MPMANPKFQTNPLGSSRVAAHAPCARWEVLYTGPCKPTVRWSMVDENVRLTLTGNFN
jgi:hypothetical protein